MNLVEETRPSAQGIDPLGGGPAPKPLRVAYLTNQIPPYRVAKFTALGRTPGWDFRVFTCVERESNRQWEVERNLPFHHQRSLSFSYVARRRRLSVAAFEEPVQVHLPVGHFADLCRFRPGVTISAEFGVRSLIAAAYARLFRTTFFLASEATAHTSRDCTPGQRLLRRFLVRRPHGYLCNGRQSRFYLEALGAPPHAIFEIGQALDAGPYQRSWSDTQRQETRSSLGIAGLCYLFTGQLIPRKGIDRLLEAWGRFTRQQGVEATLLLVGDGPLRASLEGQAARAGLRNVLFHDFVQPAQMPDIYRAADLYVFPSLEDCWSLAVEEAMASGLPVIDSRYNGGSELIVEGENGWVADPLQSDDLVNKLALAWAARDRRESMGSLARQTIERMSVENVAARVRSAVAEILARGGGRP